MTQMFTINGVSMSHEQAVKWRQEQDKLRGVVVENEVVVEEVVEPIEVKSLTEIKMEEQGYTQETSTEEEFRLLKEEMAQVKFLGLSKDKQKRYTLLKKQLEK
jgi:hypothetical protein